MYELLIIVGVIAIFGGYGGVLSFAYKGFRLAGTMGGVLLLLGILALNLLK